jgi:hypothetical protein
MGDPPGNVDLTLLEKAIDRVLERRAAGGGGGSDFEQRLLRVERALADLQAQITRMEAKIDQLPKAADFFELKGRVSQLPTIWQLIWPLMAFVATIFGLAFVLLRFALPRG